MFTLIFDICCSLPLMLGTVPRHNNSVLETISNSNSKWRGRLPLLDLWSSLLKYLHFSKGREIWDAAQIETRPRVGFAEWRAGIMQRETHLSATGEYDAERGLEGVSRGWSWSVCSAGVCSHWWRETTPPSGIGPHRRERLQSWRWPRRQRIALLCRRPCSPGVLSSRPGATPRFSRTSPTYPGTYQHTHMSMRGHMSCHLIPETKST